MTVIRYLFFSMIFFGALAFGSLCFILNHHVVNFEPLAHYNPGKPSILLDDEGREWGRFQLEWREPVTLNHIAPHVQHAFIAAEDWHFFSHMGISLKGIARSVITNIMHGKKAQGASTITQQLIKLLFFDSKKTFRRKIKEQLYALLAERQYTKEQILQTYLNHVYFGHGIYGVEAASQRFWGKHASELSIDEAATLAAVIKSPRNYTPIMYPLSAQRRRNIILGSMKKLGFITTAEYEVAIATTVIVKEGESIALAPHVKEMIRIQLEEELGKEKLYKGGLIIQTTLNRSVQEAAQKSFVEHVAKLKKDIDPAVDGALISIDVATGQVKALVGGFDFAQSKFNRAWSTKRQIGSVLKPLLYAVAVEQGASFADVEIDEPVTIVQHNARWSPHNYNHRFDGSMTLAYALMRSNNIISIKTLLKTGADPVVALTRMCRIPDPIYPYPSLALGCVDASLKEMVGMFNVFANNGVYVEPHLISWIKDSWGTKIYKPTIDKELVLSPVAVSKVSKVLELGIKRWRKLYKKELVADDVICKTGTTNDCRTCWFAGATADLATAVYIGCDDNRPMGDVYPIRTAFPIWLGVHQAVLPTGKKFTYDPHLKPVLINQWTGRQTYRGDPDGIEIFA